MKSEFINDLGNLDTLLQVSDVEDLAILVDYITDKGEGRITLDSDVCERLVGGKEKGEFSALDRSLIAYEILRFGGNTLSNVYRDMRNSVVGSFLDKVLPDADSSISYDEVVRDVASHLKVSFNKESATATIEEGILRKLLSDSIEKMTDEERKELLEGFGFRDYSVVKPTAAMVLQLLGKMGGFKTFQMAVIVANAIAKAILGRGLPFVAGPIITKTVGVVLGPIGWIVTGLWTVADMASPAYRVTVPCVVQIAYMRQKLLMKEHSKTCKSCNELNELNAKFCSECGTAL